VRLTFLGTGASGGTPGTGRSARRESSLLVEAGPTVLIDVTRHFSAQSATLRRLDGVLLTHAHRDAAGGVPQLRRWWSTRRLAALPLHAMPEVLTVLRDRHRRLDHLELVPVSPGRRHRVGSLTVIAEEVPHARDPRYRTCGWRLEHGTTALVYASDVGGLRPPLERLADGADLLVIDGAMWGRQLFSHLTIDRELPRLCRWNVGRILLTQIGRTAPPHPRLEREVAELCPKAAPAWDGLTVELS
jgi:phosphoribosyl 1,2-cyclic phosphodiesterase